MTGDFVTRRNTQYIYKLKSTLSQLTPQDKTVVVLGNHDYWANPEAISKALVENGIVNLSNGVYTVKRGSVMLHIAGVDDVCMGENRLDLRTIRSGDF